MVIARWTFTRLFRQALLLLAMALAGPAAFGQFNLRVDSFDPTFGPAGTTVMITGADFSGATSVRFGTAQADFQILSSTQIQATVPPDGETGPISVVNVFTTSSAAHFTIGPRITGFDKPIAGVGDTLRIDGANFINAQTTVKFGNVSANVVNVTAANQMFVTVPIGAVTGPISVSTFAGATVTSTNYIIANTAVILDFTPVLGTPGTQVVLNGGDFSNASAIRFGGVNATFNVTAISQIIATVPQGAVSGLIEVVTPSGTGSSLTNFTVLTPGPTFLTVTPPAGKPGDPIVLGGVNLTSVNQVTFNGVIAHFGVTADTQISAVVPTGAVTGPIVMHSPFGNATSPSPFLVESVITGFQPVGGVVGSQIVIDGFNLDSATYVHFNGVPAAIAVVAPNQVHATVPGGATTGPITVGFATGSNTTSNNFVVSTGDPIIIDFTPTNGFAGNEIVLSGVQFFGATAVLFNGAAASFGVTAHNQILATVPPDATSGPLTIVGPGGTNTTPEAFYVPPRLTSISPLNGVVGSEITIMGTNFLDTVQVGFSGSNGAQISAVFTVDNNTLMRATVPTNAQNGPITITAPGGIVVGTQSFGMVPRIDLVAPLWGPVGSQVTLSGISFEHAIRVEINGVTAPIVSNSDSHVTATVPNLAQTGPLRVFTSTTNAAAPADFVVTRIGDLALSLSNPRIVPNGQPVPIDLVITNHGPTVATGVRLALTMPNHFSFLSATGALATCSVEGNQVICTWPSVTNNVPAVPVRIVMTPNVSGGVHLGTILLTKIEPEDIPLNNSTNYIFSLATIADRNLVALGTNTNEVRVHWQFSGSPFILQSSTNELAPAMIWNDVPTNLITLFTNFDSQAISNLFKETAVGPRRFYRLRSP
ncbi:MAG: hypothetical protein CMO80_15580 [Verrucomicrobiales bacterium]|nr:hypothetical protein [Verrucomicrobiales bacterium]